jgi:DNA-binding transcriptional LysR family regulator
MHRRVSRNDTPIDVRLLVVFVAVADAKSFSKAAQALHLTKGTVSRSIARLEEIVEADLFHRTTHSVALSTAGTALYERCGPHITALKHAVKQLPEHDEEPSGELRLTAPPDFGAVVLPSILAEFALRFPAIRFDVVLTHAFVDLVGEGIDVALRFGANLTDSSLIARRLGRVGMGFYASASYLARRGTPRSLRDDKHDWVVPSGARPRFGLPRDLACRVQCDDFLFVRELLREGAGVGLLPAADAEPYVRQGLLTRVAISSFDSTAIGWAYLVYPSSGQVSRKVTAFRDFLVDHFAKVRLD